jgi:hypothetical protein
MKTKKKIVLIVSIAIVIIIALAALQICHQHSTWLPQGSITIHNQGESVTLIGTEARTIRALFTLHFYRYGIGGCPYSDGVSITIGDREFFLAADGCPTAKDSINGNCIEFNQVDWKQIQKIFNDHYGKTLIN